MSKEGAEQRRQPLKKKWDEAIQTVEGYHVHIYFEPGTDSENKAWHLADDMKSLFDQDIENIHAVGRRGPHISHNVALDISRESFGRIVAWLQMNNNGLSVLVHPQTGDDVKDHLQSSLWINREVGYNQAFFDRLAERQRQEPRQG